MDNSDLLEYISVKYLPFAVDYINTLEEKLKLYSSMPQVWADDLNNMISYLDSHLSDADFFLPAELREEVSNTDEVLKQLKKYLYLYGRLLTLWPDIRHEAGLINNG